MTPFVEALLALSVFVVLIFGWLGVRRGRAHRGTPSTDSTSITGRDIALVAVAVVLAAAAVAGLATNALPRFAARVIALVLLVMFAWVVQVRGRSRN